MQVTKEHIDSAIRRRFPTLKNPQFVPIAELITQQPFNSKIFYFGNIITPPTDNFNLQLGTVNTFYLQSTSYSDVLFNSCNTLIPVLFIGYKIIYT